MPPPYPPEHSEALVDRTTVAAPEKKDLAADLPVRPNTEHAKQAQNRMRTQFSGWLKKLKKLNPAAWWTKSAVAKPAIPKFSKAPVQGELSLDNIKVVRNDLNEADVEVVVKRPMTGKTPTALAETVAADLVRT